MMGSNHSVEDLEALRQPLMGLCYRMLGSVHDAEDAVQETLTKAHLAFARFDPSRGRLSTWVHQIATNHCLDMLRSAERRVIVPDMPDATSGSDLGEPRSTATWIEPIPISRVEIVGDPADKLVSRESVRLAFLAALQVLPPRQRAVLILRDVLAYSAGETAEALDATVAAVTSALQRARKTMEQCRFDRDEFRDKADPATAELVHKFVSAFEAHDAQKLAKLLHDHAVLSMPPFAWAMRGGLRIAQQMAEPGSPCAGARLISCDVNGGVGLGHYRPDGVKCLRPFALMTIEAEGNRISRIVTFLGTGGRFVEFGLPAFLSSEEQLWA